VPPAWGVRAVAAGAAPLPARPRGAQLPLGQARLVTIARVLRSLINRSAKEERERREVFERLDRALAAASDRRTHDRLAPVQPVAELMTDAEYTRWRSRMQRRHPGVLIPEPRPGQPTLVLFLLRPSTLEPWLRGQDVNLVQAPTMVFPPDADRADAALAAAITGYLESARDGVAVAAPLLRRAAGGPFGLEDLGRSWPGERSRARSRLAERPLRRRD
jgi:hypothetical protein